MKGTLETRYYLKDEFGLYYCGQNSDLNWEDNGWSKYKSDIKYFYSIDDILTEEIRLGYYGSEGTVVKIKTQNFLRFK